MEMKTGLGWESETRGCELSNFGITKGMKTGDISQVNGHWEIQPELEIADLLVSGFVEGCFTEHSNNPLIGSDDPVSSPSLANKIFIATALLSAEYSSQVV
ncbi:hypothetical protein DUI87_13082 [Hirundo rustica rustica]|uniref:Uncharacterized protein n=1 Tax=Hirundo rustica rustica TaxID=333673 RepID=A0A3M0KH65_HIRRU|nr:hypothetical protein DUI87_13082 [Hirundo rustica rustica]